MISDLAATTAERPRGGGELGTKQGAAAMEPRHYRSQRNGQCLCNFLIGQLLDVTQYDHLLMLNGNPPEGAEQIFVRQFLRHGWHKWRHLSDSIVRVVDEPGPAARPPAIAADVLQNRGQPGATVSTWLEAM